jgi:hypothetical protein
MKNRIARSFTLLACATLLLAAGGCSTFHHDWRQAAAQPAPADDITGRWEGTWQSDVNGHHGGLRCVVTKESPGKYRIHYRATWKKILHGSYNVEVAVRREGGTFKSTGGADLGWKYGGHYSYEGDATPTEFTSTYKSKGDHGTFKLKRPER